MTSCLFSPRLCAGEALNNLVSAGVNISILSVRNDLDHLRMQ